MASHAPVLMLYLGADELEGSTQPLESVGEAVPLAIETGFRLLAPVSATRNG